MSKTDAAPPKPTVGYGHLLSGGIAGAVSRTATSPLERLRILQQTASPAYKGKGTIGSFVYMYKSEGMAGYFKGNGATIMKIAPFSAFEFYFYEIFKGSLFPGRTKNQLGFGQKLVCGGLTGVVASTLTYPFDIVKTYLTISLETGASKISMSQQAKIIVDTYGVMGLYKGWGLSMLGIAPFIGIKMASFDLLMDKYSPGKSDPWVRYKNLGLGASAGTIAVTFTYPIDLTRRLLQLNGQPGHNYTGMLDCFKQLYAKEGFGGFWKGLWATYLKVAPMTAILFLTNEQLKRAMNI
jgi:solute carrier family 25 phosphate transporter 23/24/25/41